MTGKPHILWVPWKTLGSRFHLLKSPAACNGKLTSFLKVQGGNSAVILISLVNKLSEISLLIAIRALWWVKTPLCTHLYQIHEGIYIFHLKMDGLNYWIHGCKHYNCKLCSLPFKKKIYENSVPVMSVILHFLSLGKGLPIFQKAWESIIYWGVAEIIDFPLGNWRFCTHKSSFVFTSLKKVMHELPPILWLLPLHCLILYSY